MALFWSAALLTQILSDAATTVLLAPISIALAVALGLPPEPFVVCTALGAVVAFLTPIGHHGNLLILNPGQYTFGDFLRVGVPLTIFISLVSVWLAGPVVARRLMELLLQPLNEMRRLGLLGPQRPVARGPLDDGIERRDQLTLPAHLAKQNRR